MTPPADHSAAASALGYLYQCDWALLELIRGSRWQPDSRISLELYDDVAWDEGATPTELLQLKHHLKTDRPLSDVDVDVWRTINVWIDAADSSNLDPPILTLVTTKTAADGTALAKLRPSQIGTDYRAALQLLENAAVRSEAEATRGAREAFLAMDSLERELLVKRIRVLDGAPQIDDLSDQIRAELRWGLPMGHQDEAIERLLGWWHAQALDMLQNSSTSIGAVQLLQFLEDLRSGYQRDNLPTYDELGLDPENTESYEDMVFVHQLRWVSAPAKILETAISDYYRAYAHAKKWYEEDLLGADELPKFEARLKDEWQRAFAFATASLGAKADESEKQVIGRNLLQTTLDRVEPRVRERYSEPFFTRGTHHRLADERELGWHPDFETKLEELLLGRSA